MSQSTTLPPPLTWRYYIAYMASIALQDGTAALEAFVEQLLDSLPRDIWDDGLSPAVIPPAPSNYSAASDIFYDTIQHIPPLGSQSDGKQASASPPSSPPSSADNRYRSPSVASHFPAPASVVLSGKNPVSQLMEHAMQRGENRITWGFGEGGLGHERSWEAQLRGKVSGLSGARPSIHTVAVLQVGGILVGTGTAATKQLAKSLAATAGMEKLGWPVRFTVFVWPRVWYMIRPITTVYSLMFGYYCIRLLQVLLKFCNRL